MVFQLFTAGGQRGWGGSLANEDAPPSRVNVPAFFSENGKRLSQEPQQILQELHLDELQGMAMVGPCFK